ncbi:28317_t:CDS:2, partial [Racocetra persica]
DNLLNKYQKLLTYYSFEDNLLKDLKENCERIKKGEEEFADTTAHEAAHVPTWYEVPPPDGEFSDFINQPSSKARFSVNEEIPNPKSYYQLEYGFDPNED